MTTTEKRLSIATKPREMTATDPDRSRDQSPAILITGAGGEIGHGLISSLAAAGRSAIVAIDICELDEAVRSQCEATFKGDICDQALLNRVFSSQQFSEVYHLAALLSTRAESAPEKAHDVNVNGTLNLLRLAAEHGRMAGHAVRFMFPSSIAVYGLPNLSSKTAAGAVAEDQYLTPTTMYGCNKLYCEHLGRYFAKHYRRFTANGTDNPIDFRAIRFPGIISSETIPSGGTSDFAPEMIHAAAQGHPYACFVRDESRIPFMTMPDAIDALRQLAQADRPQLTRCVYNIKSFNPSACEVAAKVLEHFPDSPRITFEPDAQRQAIVDTWPADIDDTAARQDWGYAPKHNFAKAFEEYLVPRIRERYSVKQVR